jgi:hypothetical protein
MRFLANGDFNFPFEWTIYWAKHFYIWSFQSGTPNPDGLIRLPGRVLNFLVFGLFGNVGVSYFYLLSSLAVAFVAFYFFAKNFLGVRQRSVLILGALFFALNPIFLGNLAKVGLVLAAAMLPLCLLAIKAAFEKRRMRYFLLFFACLNISFLHPYTFTVNVGVSAAYFLYLAWRQRQFVFANVHKFIMIAVAGVLLNLYFALPLMSMGTVSKDVISDNVVPTAQDYTALVNVSNTGDLFTGLSLSKNIFLDFDFYNSSYRSIYFLGVFAFYVLLIAIYVSVEKRLKQEEKRRLALFLGAFLVLIALATTTFMNLDVLIKFLIGMPGGWAFRSPLKWQLYIPLVLFGVLVALLARVTDRVRMAAFQAGLIVIFVMMNAYVTVDVVKKIMTPRSFENFGALMQTDLDNKTLLFVNNGECMDFLRAHPRVTTELGQVFVSKEVQVKRVLSDSIDGVNLGSYDYVLGCKPEVRLTSMLKQQYQFEPKQAYAQNTFQLYANKQPSPPVYAADKVFSLPEPVGRVADKYQFAAQELGTPLRFVPGENSGVPTTGLHDVFETIQTKNIEKGEIRSSIATREGGKQQLFARDNGDGTPLFYRLEGSQITLSSHATGGMQALTPGLGLDLPERPGFDIKLLDPAFDGKNLIRNSSLEQGLWRSKVSDCYAFDKQPDIAMKLSKEHSDGRQALQLEAKRHIACSGPDKRAVKPKEHYAISFDYQSLGKKRFAGYHVIFDDPKHTFIQERLPEHGDGWHDFSREVEVPEGATHLKIMLYAYPEGGDSPAATMTRYDNLRLFKVPALQDRFYLVSGNEQKLQRPSQLTYTIVDPTKKAVTVKGAGHPFFLATSETYSPLWRLGIDKGSAFSAMKPLPGAKQVRLNGTMNAWYVDPAGACKQAEAGCVKQADGTYDLTLAMTFTPQRSFYVGAVISGLTFIACVIYFIYSHQRDHASGSRKGGGRWS